MKNITKFFLIFCLFAALNNSANATSNGGLICSENAENLELQITVSPWNPNRNFNESDLITVAHRPPLAPLNNKRPRLDSRIPNLAKKRKHAHSPSNVTATFCTRILHTKVLESIENFTLPNTKQGINIVLWQLDILKKENQIITKLKHQGAIHLGITSQSPKFANEISDNLKQLGINFAKLSNLENQENSELFLQEGVVYTRNQEQPHQYTQEISKIITAKIGKRTPITFYLFTHDRGEIDLFCAKKSKSPYQISFRPYLCSGYKDHTDELIFEFDSESRIESPQHFNFDDPFFGETSETLNFAGTPLYYPEFSTW